MRKIEYIWLSKLNISNKIKKFAIEKLGGIDEFYNSSLDDLVYLNFSDNLIYKILNRKLKDESKKEFDFMKLKLIDDYPLAFYIRGNENILDNKSIRDCRS